MTSTTVEQLPAESAVAGPVDGVLLDHVTKRYEGTERPALDVDELHIPGKSLTVLVGPSGCGKTTALRMMSGLDTPTSGRLLIDGTDVTHVAPGKRGVSMVFQDFALYPHMTVERNISFGLRLEAKHNRHSGLDRAEIERRVAEACATLGLTELRRRRPGQLSGGERQRVGLARAIVRRPKVLLLDEPLSALDAKLRQQARAELVRLHRELGNTIVMVTHDQLEGLSMATNLVVMKDARVQQAGRPTEVYRRPVNTFVATFLGSPPMNLATVRVPGGTGDRLAAPGLDVRLPSPLRDVPGELTLGWRPADATLGADGPRPGLVVDGVVDLIEFTGDSMIAQCTSDAGRWAVVVSGGDRVPAVGDPIRAHMPVQRLHLFDPESGNRVEAGNAYPTDE